MQPHFGRYRTTPSFFDTTSPHVDAHIDLPATHAPPRYVGVPYRLAFEFGLHNLTYYRVSAGDRIETATLDMP